MAPGKYQVSTGSCGFFTKNLCTDLPSFFINYAIHLPGYISEGQAEIKHLKVTVSLLIGFV